MRWRRRSPGRAWRTPVTGKLIPALLALLPGPAEACRLALLLALDVSSSVDAGEDALQRAGLASALDAPEVRAAMLGHGPVALAAFEWSGKWQQDWILPWRVIRSGADLDAAILAVGGSARVETRYPTAIGYAIGWASRAFRDGPVCVDRTLDVSGDGENNDGFVPALAYENFPLAGVTVNGLVIGGDPGLLRYYETEVIRGPFSFVEVALDYRDYERAMRRKLERELTPKVIGALE